MPELPDVVVYLEALETRILGAVLDRFGEPCPECGSPVQRIVYAENETNYCAPCQTGGKLLADRAMSRLLKKDWPRSLEELEDCRTEIREIMGVAE